MPLENAQYIHQLEAANPAGSDQLAQGDDHLRMIKAVLKSTFPNIQGPVTKTEDELNSTGFSMPIGVITAWYGNSGSVPAGWAICNGQIVARTDGEGDIATPDLRDRTVVGAGVLAAQGTAVGAVLSSVNTGTAGAHTHTISGGEHTHIVNVSDTQTGGSITTTQDPVDGSGGFNTITGVTFSPGPAHRHTATAEAAPHSHTVSEQGAHAHSVSVSTVQPSMGLHWIMKV